MVERSLVPSEVLGQYPAVRTLGEVIELIVKGNYSSSKGGCEEFLSPGSQRQTDFFDVGMGFSRCRHLAAYFKLHNPVLDAVLIGQQCESRKDSDKSFPVPDIITHEPPTRTEFYEVKPNSAAGKGKGQEKIAWFQVVSQDQGLPYTVGNTYSPNKRLIIYNGTYGGVPVKIRLHFFLDSNGLLVYEFCVTDVFGRMRWPAGR